MMNNNWPTLRDFMEFCFCDKKSLSQVSYTWNLANKYNAKKQLSAFFHCSFTKQLVLKN
jgi:hypothetical protein